MSGSLMLAATLLAQGGSAEMPQARADALTARFVTQVRRCGFEPPQIPKTIVQTTPQIIWYGNSEDKNVHLPYWPDIPPELQQWMGNWAKAGTMGLTPRQQFEEIFNSLLVPHELGHWLGDLGGRLAKMSHWEGEVEANRIAVAFWSLDRADAARLPKRITNFTGFLGKLPNPVPKGQDVAEYFNSNYEKLGADPNAYGWYQGAFMRTAWSERGKWTFCDLVKRNAMPTKR